MPKIRTPNAPVEIVEPPVVPSVDGGVLHVRGGATVGGVTVPHGPLDGSVGDALRRVSAGKEIDKKATQLGWAGSITGPVKEVGPGVYLRPYEHCDIYYSAGTGAHEVHGDIRAKYVALNGVHLFGPPMTDESGTPDGIGRFNHFQHSASIYWTMRTGPMSVGGSVRDRWQNDGWEAGALGYPVVDTQRLAGLSPADSPNIAWCVFENGAIVTTGDGSDKAVFAELTSEQMRTFVRTRFDAELHRQSGNLGLQPQVEMLDVSQWGYGFWASVPRQATYRLHGFHKNPVVADTDFVLDVRLRFSTAWPSLFTAPTFKTLIAALDSVRVSADGWGHEELARRLANGVHRVFFRGSPDPDRPHIPDGAIFIADFPTGVSQTGQGNIDVIDVLTTAQGGLQVLLNPMPPIIGGIRRMVAQQRIDIFLQG